MSFARLLALVVADVQPDLVGAGPDVHAVQIAVDALAAIRRDSMA